MTRTINLLLAALLLAAPFVLAAGCEKQNNIEIARAGQ